MAYIEDRIDCLEDRLCKLERQLENRHLEDRVSTLEDIVETDGEKLDRLSERVEQKPQVQQTITEEFVRIVRCKDCVWYVNVPESQTYDRCINEDGLFDPKPDDYCVYGEKRNENNN